MTLRAGWMLAMLCASIFSFGCAAQTSSESADTEGGNDVENVEDLVIDTGEGVEDETGTGLELNAPANDE